MYSNMSMFKESLKITLSDVQAVLEKLTNIDFSDYSKYKARKVEGLRGITKLDACVAETKF